MRREGPRSWLPFRRRRDESAPLSPEDGLQVRSDFEGGNVTGVTVVSPAHVRFAADPGSSPRPLWFYFCLENAQVPAVRCDLINADQCLGPREGWRTVRPVFGPDGRSWQRAARSEYVDEGTGSGYFSFTVPVVGPRTYVAYCYPYTTSHLDALLRSLPHRQGLRQGELCRSAEGRPVPYLMLGNHDSPAYSVWILARQHAGESPASYVLEGLIQYLSRLEPLVLQALADTALHVVPMLDVDGVFHGRYGKDEEPVDFNRDWRDHPSRPEVQALLRAVRASHGRCPVDLALDIHASHHGDTSCYAFGSGPDAGEEILTRQGRFLRCLAEESPSAVGFRETDLRTGHQPAHSARVYLGQTFRIPALTLEMSYHLAQSWEYLTQRDYRDFGTGLVRAVHRYLHEPAS